MLVIIFLILLAGLIVCIGLIVSKNGEIKRLKDYSRYLNEHIKKLTWELDQARRALGSSGPQAAVPAPKEAAGRAVPAAAPAAPSVSAQTAAPAAPAVSGQAAAPAPGINVQRPQVPQYTYNGYTAPAQAAQAQPPRAPQQAAYQAPQRPAKEKTSISSINISFGVGVLLMTIVGAVFISSSWGSMGDATRATVLIGAVAIVYLLSLLSGKVLGLRQTGFSFFTLGSLLMPVVITGIGAMGLWGPWFSFSEGNGFLVGAVAALFLGAAGLAGSYIYKSGAYNGITYFGFTWTLMFTAAQMGSGAKERFLFAFLAIAFTALVCRLVLLSEFGRNIKYFKPYADIMFWIGTCLAFIVEFMSEAYICAGIAAIAGAVFLKIREGNTKMKYLLMALCLALPVSLTSWYTRISHPLDVGFSEVGWEGFAFFILTAVFIGASYAVLDRLKFSDIISDIVYPVFTGLISTYYTGIVITDDYIGIYALTAGAVLCCAAFVRAAFRSGYSDMTRNVFAAFASLFSYGAFLTGFILVFWEQDGRIPSSIVASIALAVSAVMVFMVRNRRVYPSIITYFACSLITALFLKESTEGSWNYVGAVLMTVSFIPIIAATFIKFGKKKKVIEGGVVLVTCAVISLFFTLNEFFAAVQIPFIIYTGLLAAAVAAAGLTFVKKNERLAPYAKIFYYIFYCIGIIALMAYSFDQGQTVEAIVIAALFTGASYLNRKTIPTVFSLLLLGWNASMYLSDNVSYEAALVLILIGAFALFLVAGRLLHRKDFIKGEYMDAFTPASLVFLTFLPSADYTSLLVFIALAAGVLNLAGRVKVQSKVIYSISLSLVFLGLIVQQIVDLPTDFGVEIRLALILIDVLLIRYVIKPGKGEVTRYLWFAAVAFALAVEAVSAAMTGYITDLLIVGVTSAGIFVYAFLRKAKLWFVLAVVAILGIAVYLSLTFWGSGVWTLYLLAAGTLLISMAAYNEYCKRKAAEAGSDKKKRFFEEWTW